MSQHTPGSFIVEDYRLPNGYVTRAVAAVRKPLVCNHCRHTTEQPPLTLAAMINVLPEEADANARLFAKAPEMAAFLRELWNDARFLAHNTIRGERLAALLRELKGDRP